MCWCAWGSDSCSPFCKQCRIFRGFLSGARQNWDVPFRLAKQETVQLSRFGWKCALLGHWCFNEAFTSVWAPSLKCCKVFYSIFQLLRKTWMEKRKNIMQQCWIIQVLQYSCTVWDTNIRLVKETNTQILFHLNTKRFFFLLLLVLRNFKECELLHPQHILAPPKNSLDVPKPIVSYNLSWGLYFVWYVWYNSSGRLHKPPAWIFSSGSPELSSLSTFNWE